jgi:hypothetical protein
MNDSKRESLHKKHFDTNIHDVPLLDEMGKKVGTARVRLVDTSWTISIINHHPELNFGDYRDFDVYCEPDKETHLYYPREVSLVPIPRNA